jgi:hypothetical protein
MVTIKIYDKLIVVPTKCGSRFCDEVCKGVTSSVSFLEELFHLKPKFFIVRNPKEHFYSALNTEFTSELNSDIYKDGMSYEILDKVFSEALRKLKDGTNHYDPHFYKKLYEKNLKIDFIDLENLNDLLSGIYDENIYEKYSKVSYSHEDMNYYMSNKLRTEIYRNNYKDYYEFFENRIVDEMSYYEKLNVVKDVNYQYIKNKMKNLI